MDWWFSQTYYRDMLERIAWRADEMNLYDAYNHVARKLWRASSSK